ncbi:MAG: hypothetical protein RLZZ457_995 [Pseudomonadota bacterium]
MTYRLTNLAATAAAFLLSSTGSCWAQHTWALTAPQWNHSSDSDGLKIDKFAVAALPIYQSGYQWQGVELQQQRYRQNGNAMEGQSLSYVAQKTDPLTGLGHSYKAGWNQGLNQSLLTGEFNWNQAYNEKLQWGVFANRDWVESFAALQNNVHYELIGGNVDYQVHPRLTTVASLAQTRFSDHHDRQQQRLRIVWDALPDHGVTLQWAYKHQLGEKTNTTPLYYNPERLDESIAFVGWRKRIQGWQLYARAGWGSQKVADQESTPARVSEINLTSPAYRDQFLKIRIGSTQTMGLNGPGYVYRYADVQWIFRLNR